VLRVIERRADPSGRLDAAGDEQVEPLDLALAVRVARRAQVVVIPTIPFFDGSLRISP
jgi:hypothetical protein